METITQDGITIIILEGGEDLANNKVETASLIVRRPLKCPGWYYVVKNRYGGYGKMWDEFQFKQEKAAIIEKYGVKQHVLSWHNVRHDKTGNTGWEATSKFFGPSICGQTPAPRRYCYFPELNNDKVVWHNYSSATFKGLPNTFDGVETLKKLCQYHEDTFKQDGHVNIYVQDEPQAGELIKWVIKWSDSKFQHIIGIGKSNGIYKIESMNDSELVRDDGYKLYICEHFLGKFKLLREAKNAAQNDNNSR